jgi:hypothetical protein
MIPVSAPFQPAWAAPTTRLAGSANRIGPQSAVFQVHSAEAVIVEAPFSERPRADAMATRVPGLALGTVIRRRFSATAAGSSLEPSPPLRLAYRPSDTPPSRVGLPPAALPVPSV